MGTYYTIGIIKEYEESYFGTVKIQVMSMPEYLIKTNNGELNIFMPTSGVNQQIWATQQTWVNQQQIAVSLPIPITEYIWIPKGLTDVTLKAFTNNIKVRIEINLYPYYIPYTFPPYVLPPYIPLPPSSQNPALTLDKITLIKD